MKNVFLFSLVLIHALSFAQQAQDESIDQLIKKGELDKAKNLVETMDAGANRHNYSGTIYLQRGQYNKALDEFMKALDLIEDAGENLDLAWVYSNIGVAEWAQGNNSRSLEYHFRALAIRQKLKNQADIAASYNDIGLVYSQSDPDKALEFYEKAMEIYNDLYDEKDEHIATAHVNIGILYRNIEFYGDAIVHLEEAFKIREANLGPNHGAVGFVKSSLGNVYYAMDDLKSAEEFQNQALEIYRSYFGQKHPEISNTFNFIGNIKVKDSKYDEAIENYQNAIVANLKDFNGENNYDLPILDNYYNADILLFSLLQKAQAFESHYYTKSLRYKDLRASYDHIIKCDSLIDQIRQHKTNEADKIALGLIANEVYEDGIRFCLALAELNKNKQMFLDMAFYFAEKSKSAVLLEAIAETNAKSFANLPAEMLAKEESLKADIAYYQQKLAEKPAESIEKEFRNKLFDLNNQYVEFSKYLETNYKEYYNLKYNTSIPSVTEIQSVIDEKSVLLSYFIADKTKRLYAFTISKDKYKIHNVKLENDVNRSLLGFRNAIYYSVMGTFASTSHELYNLLIPKSLGKGIEQLIIIPSGRLGTIPFEALLTEESNNNTPYSELPYLINQYSINIQYASSLFVQSMKNSEKSSSDNICLIAPVDFDAFGLPMLPGTATEVDAISTIFTQSNIASSAYLHEEANEGLVTLKEFTNSKYIHFATHGIVDEDQPELSQIFMVSDSKEDGNLYSGEIYNLTLNADLVTLSACQTGLGKVYKGEGIIGLSRALVYSGANNLVVSLWSVADQSTSELMVEFYEGLITKKLSYSSSLQQAKKKLISSNSYSAPYYWAPFVLIGN